MTENFYTTKNYKPDHRRFGGVILPSDFNTDNRGKDNANDSFIASRIFSDLEFDRRCKRNAEFRDRNNRKKNMK